MPRYVALLRGINVGGHRVTMSDLRRHVAPLQFDGVETFIASGNILFASVRRDLAALESALEEQLSRALGYAVPTFVRTIAEVAATSRWLPFARADEENDTFSRYVLFLRSPLDARTRQAVEELSCRTDEFRVQARELHWLRRGKISEETPAGKALDKLLRASATDATMRNIKMLRRLVAQEEARVVAAPASTAATSPRASRVTRAGTARGRRARSS